MKIEKEVVRNARDRVLERKLSNVVTIGGAKSKLKAANDAIEWLKTDEGRKAIDEEISRQSK